MSDLLEKTGHRPWPLPEGAWVLKQTWQNVLFAHWRVPVEIVRPLVPAPLEVETWDGSAWLGITPFCLSGVRLRGTPAVPFLSTFPEVDVRTYVRLEERPGVFYFGLEAPNPVIAAAARLVYHPPGGDPSPAVPAPAGGGGDPQEHPRRSERHPPTGAGAPTPLLSWGERARLAASTRGPHLAYRLRKAPPSLLVRSSPHVG